MFYTLPDKMLYKFCHARATLEFIKICVALLLLLQVDAVKLSNNFVISYFCVSNWSEALILVKLFNKTFKDAHLIWLTLIKDLDR